MFDSPKEDDAGINKKGFDKQESPLVKCFIITWSKVQRLTAR
jgi:hypothetical protein